MKGLEVYWRITDRCNLVCRHCCYDCGPSGESVTPENAERIVDHLPDKLETLTLTGGEPMVVRPLLRRILGYINQRKFPNLHTTRLQTNGYWVKNPRSTYENLVWLAEGGVNEIEFASYDLYHMEQGICVDNLCLSNPKEGRPLSSALQKLHQSHQTKLKTFLKGGYLIKPFGRGKKIKNITDDKCFLKDILFSIATIDPQGNTYPCCYQRPYSIGNVIGSPLAQLIKKAKKDPILVALNKGDLLEISRTNSLEPHFDIFCSECEDFFSQIKK